MSGAIALQARSLAQAALSGRRLPANSDFALLGDSRAAADHINSTTANVYHNVSGIGWWAQTLSRGRIWFPLAYDFAVPGSKSEDIVTGGKLAAAIASPAANVLLLASSNDRSAGWQASRSIAALDGVIRALVAARKVVWVIAELPRGDGQATGQRLSATQLAHHHQTRRWLLNARARFGPNVYVIDGWPGVADLASASGDALTTPRMTYDGLHPNATGAHQIASRWLADPFFTALYGGPDRLGWTASDGYDAVANPTGNLLANGLMTGTGGTVGNGTSGTVATNWFSAASNIGSLNVTLAKVTTATGDWQQIKIDGTAPAGIASIQLGSNVTYANLAAGDVLDATAEFEIDAGTSGVAAASFSLDRLLSGANVRSVSSGKNQGGGLPAAAISGVWRLPDTQTVAGGGVENIVQASIMIQTVASASVSLTLRARNASVRKMV